MNVTLIHATQDAATLLLFTKQTRLAMTGVLLRQVREWPAEKQAEELAYMAKTIRSSWEFVHLTFLVQGLSRAAAQQVTRTRTASFAMQSQRVADMSANCVVLPDLRNERQAETWDHAVDTSLNAYKVLIDDGMKKEDARGILPINSECNLVVQYNLRAFADMLAARRSLRAQGEYREMAREMELLTIAEWPWVVPFLEDANATAIKMLEEVASKIGITVGSGEGWEIAKAIDLLRKSS